MTQQIDPEALKASAEHLEWVLQQYPDEPTVVGILESLQPMIDLAKSGNVTEPVDQWDVPGRYNFVNGDWTPFRNPNIDVAYSRFSVAMKGGYTPSELETIALLEQRRHSQTERPKDE